MFATHYFTNSKIRPVYDGEKVFIDWKSSMEPAIFVRYSTPAGEPLIHMASKPKVSVKPLFMPKSSGKYFSFVITEALVRISIRGG